MSETSRHYTPAEAAVLSNIDIKAVHNAIDKRILESEPASTATRAGRSLSPEDILFLKIWYEVGSVLSQDRRRRLFAEIVRNPTARRVKADDLVIIDVAHARRQIGQRMRDLREAEATVAASKSVMDGEPVFKGTRIPVRLVGAML